MSNIEQEKYKQGLVHGVSLVTMFVIFPIVEIFLKNNDVSIWIRIILGSFLFLGPIFWMVSIKPEKKS